MKKVLIFPLLMVALLSSCKGQNTSTDYTLKVYNWGSYIYEKEAPEDEESIIKQFEDYYHQKTGKTVKVEYSMFDVNESAYSQISKLNRQFDLVAPSEYMIQKMIKEDMLEKYDRQNDGSYTHLPNYNQYASPYLKGIFEDMVINGDPLSDYAAGYMWGTLGIVYDPTIIDSNDAMSWSVLYDSQYAKKATIKNSMRDTYFIGVIDVYQEQLLSLRNQYLDGAISAEVYNSSISNIIERADDQTLTLVEQSLKKLKTNSYGLEVDSGKNDIVTGKIGMQVSWSGDAVYSMDLVEESTQKELEYVVPDEGGNLWFDGWVMPKGAQKELAQEFVNFISDPDIAILNMDYIGYNSFIAGDAVLNRIHDLADPDGDFDLDLTYFFDGTVAASANMVVKTVKNRQLHAQYPDQETITRSVVMQDFGERNDALVAMWTRFKTSSVDPLLIGLISGAVLVGLAIGAYFYFKNKKSQRSRRQKQKRSK